VYIDLYRAATEGQLYNQISDFLNSADEG